MRMCPGLRQHQRGGQRAGAAAARGRDVHHQETNLHQHRDPRASVP